ncbi:hypothetical protein Taro_034376 [Colocasia esculenta]|uniref:Uncharacterized protein n=1 Tax=Colocasia esculenta TaxID=4460 RepID=A0A843W9U6_COLES|nr:hypothetical protein [Colocasia esculenta]
MVGVVLRLRRISIGVRRGVSSRPQHPWVHSTSSTTTCGLQRVHARPSSGNADPGVDPGSTAGSVVGLGSGSSSSSLGAWPWWSFHHGEV